MAYRPGELDQRVELQRPIKTPDGQGGFVKTFEVYREVWAKVRPLRGAERSHSELLQASGGYLVVIRNRDGIDESWRIRWVNRDRLMNITFIQDAGARDLYLPIECERGVAT